LHCDDPHPPHRRSPRATSRLPLQLRLLRRPHRLGRKPVLRRPQVHLPMNESKPTPPHGRLVLLGINHNTAPIEIRERLAIPSTRLADATRTLLHQPGIREGLILSTCNRVELITLQDETAEAAGIQSQTQSQIQPDLVRFLHEYFAVPPGDIQPHVYEFRERE